MVEENYEQKKQAFELQCLAVGTLFQFSESVYTSIGCINLWYDGKIVGGNWEYQRCIDYIKEFVKKE